MYQVSRDTHTEEEHKILNGFWNIIFFWNWNFWLAPFHLLQCHHCWPTHTEACWIGSSPVFTLSVSCLLPSSYDHCLPAYLQLQKDIWRLKQELMKDELHRFHLWPPHKQTTQCSVSGAHCDATFPWSGSATTGGQPVISANLLALADEM